MPHIIISLALTGIIGLFHYGFFGWKGFFISVAILLVSIVVYFFKNRGNYFIEVDSEGIRWRTNLFSKFKNIPWKYITRIDYLEYEINFMLKESGQVVSFGTSAIQDKESEELKQRISDILTEREANGL